MLSGDRYRALAARGALPQRVLWASTGTKHPSCSNAKYLKALIGADTVNTAPLETIAAYRDHGQPLPRLEHGLQEAQQVLDRLFELGIDLGVVALQLEDEGVEKFTRPFDSLLRNIELKRRAALY